MPLGFPGIGGGGGGGTGSGAGDALTTNPLSQFAATTSTQMRGVISDETGTGASVFGTNPSLAGYTLTAAAVVTPTAMASPPTVDVTIPHTTRSVAADETLAYSNAAPTVGTTFILVYTADATNRTITFPASLYSYDQQTTTANTVIAASTSKTLKFVKETSRWVVYGDGVAVTGSGSYVLATSPTLVTPALGTPSAVVLTSATGLPEGGLSMTDITTNNVSTSKHGFAPKLDNNAAHYLDGTGAYSTPAGGGVAYKTLVYRDTTSDVTLTNQASAQAFFDSNSRERRKTDLTSFTSCRLIINVLTGSASANSPRIRLMYKTTDSTTIGTYSVIGTGATECACSLTTANIIDSGWITLTALAKADVFLALDMIGGDGVADPEVNWMYAEFK